MKVWMNGCMQACLDGEITLGIHAFLGACTMKR